jgi:hypothetical protein
VLRVDESVKSLVHKGKAQEYHATPTDKKVPIPQRKLVGGVEILVAALLRNAPIGPTCAT